MRASVSSLAPVLLLLASMAGCTSLRCANRRAGPVDGPDRQRAVARSAPMEPGCQQADDPPRLVRFQAAEATATAPSNGGQVLPLSRSAESSALGRFPPVDDDCSNSVQFAGFDQDLTTLSRLPPTDAVEGGSWICSQPLPDNLFDDVLADHLNYYSWRNLGALGVGVGVAAAMANTRADEYLQHTYQKNLRDVHTDDVSDIIHTPKVFGNGYVTVPAYAGAALVGWWLDDVPLWHDVGEWGRRSLRTILVGGPPMLAMQRITGGSRPYDVEGSRWQPFQATNGVSGHSFMGAVPFISAAKMTDDPFWKTAFYCGSALAAFSRVNDNQHYPSQVMLGWWMAYLAATAVDQTEQDKNPTFFPLLMDDGIGAAVEYRW